VFTNDINADAVYVLGFDGSWEATINGVPGAARSMVLSDGILYVSSWTVNEIVEIDTASLAIVGTISTGSVAKPNSLTVGGGRLWFDGGTTCSAGMAAVGVDGSGLTIYPPGRRYPACPSLATDSSGALLVASGFTPRSNLLFKYDVSGGTPHLLLKVK